MPNRLINETSPYLLQHAHNPVDWYPWSEEALKRARDEDKPILVSIGYSACHWCHVMERESFEDPDIAAFMNEHYVNIKIDREERPDLDHIYMDAVQAMTGSGGWPLNVFLLPDSRPFYGGTYFPPQKAFNRASWSDVLQGVATAFDERREELESQAHNLTEHLVQAGSFGFDPGLIPTDYTKEKVDQIFHNIMINADKVWGGFGNAPKFPQTFSIMFLLRYAFAKGDDNSKHTAVDQALLSLDKMIEGGIYDQIGGGFARYSTDTEWLAPHFEKMLYDNALLVSVLSEAYQLTKKDRYREVIEETLEFIQREMSSDGIAFYSALDADSEGEEGKFYTWSKHEIDELLGNDSPLFCDYYDVTVKGNWENKNILRVKKPLEIFAEEKGLKVPELKKLLTENAQKLLKKRNERIRPGLDDKIILGWNALMNLALGKAFAATGNALYRERAVDNMNFLFDKFRDKEGSGWFHTWKNGVAKFPAFLDDYAYLIQALLQLQEITGETKWLEEAGRLAEYVLQEFSDEESGYFFYTGKGQLDVIIRKKEIYDGAVPSGNSLMAYGLLHLALYFDRSEWRKRSLNMIQGMENVIIKYPGSFGVWACLFQEITFGTFEIAVVGSDAEEIKNELLIEYIPHRILMSSKVDSEWPLLSGKWLGDKTNIWLCQNYECRLPMGSVAELTALINREKGLN